MTITSTLRFLYIFDQSGLLCAWLYELYHNIRCVLAGRRGGARRKENYLVGIYCTVCPTYYRQIFISQWSEQIEFVCSSVDAMCDAA